MVRRPATGRGAPRHARFTRLNTATGTTTTAASTFTTTTGPAAVDTTRRGRRWPVIGVAGTCVARSGCLDGGRVDGRPFDRASRVDERADRRWTDGRDGRARRTDGRTRFSA